MENLNLTLAVASRICHDLVSPVGAVVNGADLLREMAISGPTQPDMTATVDMMDQSAGRASALIQFYRIAFGAAGDETQPVDRAALRELASALIQSPRIVFEWKNAGPPMRRGEARLLALLMLCARSVVGMRGAISMKSGPGPIFPLVITVDSPAFSTMHANLGLLDGGPVSGPPSPRSVEFWLAHEAARALGIALHVGRTTERVRIGVGVS